MTSGLVRLLAACALLVLAGRLLGTDLGPVQRQGAELRLSWTNAPGPVQLQESDSILGPWTSLGDPAATNALLVQPTAPQRFYRTTTTGGTTNAAEAAMRATLRSVGDFVSTVPRDNPVAWRTQVLSFLQARPDISYQHDEFVSELKAGRMAVALAPASYTDLIYEGTPGDERFGVFAPSIEYVLVSESTDELHLIGLFGNPPADARKVLIGGNDAAVVRWEPRKIICRLQRNGAGSAGDVQVIVREHRSNIRRITRWTLHGTYRQSEQGTAHRIDGNVSLIFRADIGEYRRVPGNVFIRPTRSAQAAKDSKVYLEAKGIDSFPCDRGSDRVIWEGDGEWKVRGFDQEVTDPAHSLVMLSVNTIDRVVGLGLAFGLFDIDASPMKVRVEPCGESAMTFPLVPPAPGDVDNPPLFKLPLEELLPDGSVFEVPLPGTETILSADNAIPAGFMENDSGARLEWNAAAAEFAPDPNAAR